MPAGRQEVARDAYAARGSPHDIAITAGQREGVAADCSHEELREVAVVLRPALSAFASDVLVADGVVLGIPANIGYMSRVLKHFFGQIFYPAS